MSTCPACGEEIIRALTDSRRWQLLNPRPDPAGNVAARRDGAGTWHARTLTADRKPAGDEHVYMVHFETCTQPEAFRRRQRDAWRKAQSDLHRDQRNRRGRRAPRQDKAIEQPGLFRISPPP